MEQPHGFFQRSGIEIERPFVVSPDPDGGRSGCQAGRRFWSFASAAHTPWTVFVIYLARSAPSSLFLKRPSPSPARPTLEVASFSRRAVCSSPFAYIYARTAYPSAGFASCRSLSPCCCCLRSQLRLMTVLSCSRLFPVSRQPSCASVVVARVDPFSFPLSRWHASVCRDRWDPRTPRVRTRTYCTCGDPDGCTWSSRIRSNVFDETFLSCRVRRTYPSAIRRQV